MARLTIIPKKGDLHYLDNFRLISILPMLGKILEKHVKNQIFEFFNHNDLFYELQFGFRKNGSTFGSIFHVLDAVLKTRNAGGYNSVAFLDLTKAFNCVNNNYFN